ncbi:MAG: hypothetical protein COU71_01935 [Parcubacteria group bacterium CG10_big_fil_rev_8_21_14_0_10_38_31]|nr:MAG: hypothetical protein COU71_01935 [Parcubacteria group bacterium CG10_big_fil_rev_8_21_14_0_10_38_31]
MPESPERKERGRFELKPAAWLVVAILLGAVVWFVFLNDDNDTMSEKSEESIGTTAEIEFRDGFVYERVSEAIYEVGLEEEEEGRGVLIPTLLILFDGVDVSSDNAFASCYLQNIDVGLFKCREKIEVPEGGNFNRGYVWVSDPLLYDGESQISVLTTKDIYLDGEKLEAGEEEGRIYFER